MRECKCLVISKDDNIADYHRVMWEHDLIIRIDEAEVEIVKYRYGKQARKLVDKK